MLKLFIILSPLLVLLTEILGVRRINGGITFGIDVVNIGSTCDKVITDEFLRSDAVGRCF